MSKGIIVIDMPSKCEHCIACLFEGLNSRYCGINDKYLTIVNLREEKPDWCPIKDVHDIIQNKSENKYGLYTLGWNDCLDEILKEE